MDFLSKQKQFSEQSKSNLRNLLLTTPGERVNGSQHLVVN